MHAGLLGNAKVFPDKFSNLMGNTLKVVTTPISLFFAQDFTYYNGTTVRDGVDKALIEYIGTAMNFQIK